MGFDFQTVIDAYHNLVAAYSEMERSADRTDQAIAEYRGAYTAFCEAGGVPLMLGWPHPDAYHNPPPLDL